VVQKMKTKRPWGSYSVLNKGEGFKVKLVEVAPRSRLSLQSHKYRSEHWVVVQGTAKIVNGRNILFLNENESTYIPKRGVHRLENPARTPLKIIEVQCGSCLLEKDIERFDDDHGRQTKDRGKK
jgi:mannose-1-phosphate guanylyltransferase/mannose-6-phosphate isomerase